MEAERDQLEKERDVANDKIQNLKEELDVAQKELAHLKILKEVHNKEFIVQGSLVITNLGTYYLAIGIGVVKLENQTFYVVSQDSPIGLILRGKKIGDKFSFNGRKFSIEDIN